jgi:hypothetical protein
MGLAADRVSKVETLSAVAPLKVLELLLLNALGSVQFYQFVIDSKK